LNDPDYLTTITLIHEEIYDSFHRVEKHLITNLTNTFNFCKYCGCETVYVDSLHALICNHCGAVLDPPDKLKAQQQEERQLRESTYTIADGSAIYNPDIYTRQNIRSGKTIAIGSGRGHTVNMRDAIQDKLRMKDGRTKEMDQIFRAQDRQMEAMGRTILEDRLELRRSSNITSSDELRAEKTTTTYCYYNPTTAGSSRRTRLSF
jgi:hypothetical protein